MDSYPGHLAPEFDGGGAVITPFADWWLRVKTSFPKVPEEVAREWLHRHWGQSPFSYLPSKAYKFNLVKFSEEEFFNIYSRLYLDSDRIETAYIKGQYMMGEAKSGRQVPNFPLKTLIKQASSLPSPFPLKTLIKQASSLPSPIIVLDNRDNHLCRAVYCPERERDLPAELLLVEGHTRHEFATYLIKENRFKLPLDVFIMSVIT